MVRELPRVDLRGPSVHADDEANLEPLVADRGPSIADQHLVLAGALV